MTMHQLIVWDHSHGIPFEVKQGEEIGHMDIEKQ
jgi:hypothetical protein